MARDDRDPSGGFERAPARRRSHAAVPVVLALLALGLAIGYYAVAIPFLLGVILLAVLVSFLSIRLNPHAASFYLSIKPSWTAIGTVFLCSLALFGASALYYLDLHAPILPLP